MFSIPILSTKLAIGSHWFGLAAIIRRRCLRQVEDFFFGSAKKQFDINTTMWDSKYNNTRLYVNP